MARFPVTERECGEIFQATKTARGTIRWTEKPNKVWISAKLPVECPLKGQLELVVNINQEEPTIFSISLLLNGVRIRGLDIGKSHENKCSDGRRWYAAVHKHTWLDHCPGGGHAYDPIDITGTQIAEIFEQFCRECNIDFRGRFIHLPTQAELPGL